MISKYYIYGKHSVISALLNPKRIIYKIFVSPSYDLISLRQLLNTNNHTMRLLNKIQIIESLEFDNLLGINMNHQGIAILTQVLETNNFNHFSKTLINKTNITLALLDQVTDPHNIGAILRSAAAFGIQAVIVPKYHNAKENATIAKTASGALETVPLLQVSNLANVVKLLKKLNFWILGLDSNAPSNNLDMINEYDNVALVFGNEHKGLRQLTKTACDLLLKIPFDKANVESLNLSNAAAITFYLRFIKHYN